jgi:exopolysaccharide production protein ExoZ
MLMVAGALVLEAAGSVRVWRSGLALGDASYALYLVHGFALAPILWRYSGASLTVRVLSCTILSVAAALFLHRAIERPIQRQLSTSLLFIFPRIASRRTATRPILPSAPSSHRAPPAP